MSAHEIQEYIFQNGLFTFFDGNQDEGMIVCRYNISDARIEYFLIPIGNLFAYQAARAHAEIDAHKKHGKKVDIGKIVKVKIND
jgi:hypothetical protein